MRRHSECQSAPQSTSVIAAAVHREDVSRSGEPCGPGAIDRHREFVAVRQRDPVALKNGAEPLRESRRKRALEAIQLDLHTGAAQLSSKPSLSARWGDDDVVTPPR